ncbi:MAG: tRNA (N(6)-L-threonylcarbamoyladenosine(37)-C(2))-methylthiotransferase MtaB [Bdellovibrionales bacterium]|jgi:threonylcarbamoyladenosine tRNA methylthiotransferase MtaB|nr:tRNA (N(6)-L-threonylcarbamoyladenosine(37)-C(2))-methylthiotransferase MtaB [Bdellovibrionales bacterium]MBT3525610.1 tRNA (N(6)-L-threonylcarbamoyladenosine(37)-C(2))-methylthiotransferase MtaB [Bdellovibrionales bacterium]
MENNNPIDSVPTVAFGNLGCRLNIAEAGALASGFTQRGYQIVPFGQRADVLFINTCTVTDRADSSCRNLIRKAHNSSPTGKVIVAGCYAQMEPEAISRMQGVDLVLGNSEKFNVFEYLDGDEAAQIRVDQTDHFWGAATTTADQHTRAFLKIQDGCNYNCSYCIIPAARGNSRAITIGEAVTQAEKLTSNGFKEIVLTGVNIGEYQRTAGERLVDLVAGVLATPNLTRLRLSSVEPNTLTAELLAILAGATNLMPHIHLPLQSGDDQILSEMRRKYTRSEYVATVNRLCRAIPGVALGADVMVGFPGESEEQFMNTYSLVDQLPITHLHIFPFSRRKGTAANAMTNQVPDHVKKDRVAQMTKLAQKKLQALLNCQLGTVAAVLFEQRDRDGNYTGYTPHFTKVRVKTELELKNEIYPVLLEQIDGEQLIGRLL